MNRRKFIKSSALALALAGCSKNIKLFDYDNWWYNIEDEGIRKQWEGFRMLEAPPENLDYAVKVPEFEVHYCDVDFIKNIGEKNQAREGLAWSDGIHNKIYVPARMIEGKIFPQRFVLGHETYNIVRFVDKQKKIFNIYDYLERRKNEKHNL